MFVQVLWNLLSVRESLIKAPKFPNKEQHITTINDMLGDVCTQSKLEELGYNNVDGEVYEIFRVKE